jgi:rare lipoprotein A
MIVKNYIYGIIFLFALIIYSCSSSSRYADDSNGDEENRNLRSTRKILAIQNGQASFYASEFNGRKTASGEIYDMNKLTAAHPTFPFGTIVRVINLSNNISVELRVNDRMPDFKNRIIDISYAAAKKIGMIQAGVQNVKVEVLKWGDR